LANTIEETKEELTRLLSFYETYDAAHDEIDRSVEALRGMEQEMSQIANPLHDLTIATFFPLNLPLYSLILFGIAPSVFAKQVFIRPPEVMHDMLSKLWESFNIPGLFPNIYLKPTPRHIFIQIYASDADVIIFTGKYQNAQIIHRQCPNSLLVYNGSGINPFVLFKDADIDLAVKKAIEMRCFNSGQDCAGPDAFFVPSSMADAFVSKLEAGVKQLKIGFTTDPETNIGPTIKEAYVSEVQDWLKDHHSHVIYGGEIDREHNYVHPTIIREQVAEQGKKEFHEFFAPFFFVLEYPDDQTLEETLLGSKFQERGMYISIFGHNPALEKKLDFVKLLRNQIVNDVERGNQEYGGYGSQSNFLLFGGRKVVKPVLVSRDIHLMLKP
jgi:acyl-CoA reductase-like NAD-dependent aldehyde dehydrogenase